MSNPDPLPAPRRPGVYRIAVVCLGNICRSPIGDVVLEDRIERAGIADRASVRSFGTGGWHEGEAMDARSARVLREAGYDPERHSARQLRDEDRGRFDLVLGMDEANVADAQEILGAGDADRVMLFRDFDPVGSGAIPDPYYGGPDGFATTLAVVERTADVLVGLIEDLLDAPTTRPLEVISGGERSGPREER